MAFICDRCKAPTVQGTKPIVRVTETRKVAYECNVRVDDDDLGKRVYEKQTRSGQEIVREEKLCPECAKETK